MLRITWLGMLAALSLAVSPAAAGSANRAWVSGHGVDQAGCGAPTAPCRSLQYTHDHIVGSGAEIDVLDPAGYGAISITKAISIVNDGVGTAGVQGSGRDAIDIDTPAGDTVYLKGLNIDGVQRAGFEGVSLISATNLVVINCVVRHFNNSGIFLSPASGTPRILVADTLVSDNAEDGIEYLASTGTAATQLVVDHVRANNNTGNGVNASLGATGFVELSVNSSAMTNNAHQGLLVNGNAVAGVDSSVMEANTLDGATVSSGAILHLSRSVLIQNGQVGVLGVISDPAPQVFSTGDNRLFGNNTGAVAGTSLVFEAPQ